MTDKGYRELPSQSLLMELLEYTPSTGEFFWRKRDRSWFKSARDCSAWNTNYKGKAAGSIADRGRYINIVIFGRQYRAHRLAWIYIHGSLHSDIDHINHNGMDNRISNLRLIRQADNNRNQSLSKNNTTGVTGVYKSNGRKLPWCARIKVNRKYIHLGYFATLDEARRVREAANNDYGFHSNHGTRND